MVDARAAATARAAAELDWDLHRPRCMHQNHTYFAALPNQTPRLNSNPSSGSDAMTKPHRSPAHSRGQTLLRFRTWGGVRKGAGRPRETANVGLLPHVSRPVLDPHVPMHLTLRAVRGTPSVRSERITAIVREELRRASAKGFRVVHYSIQTNHLHLIVEADRGLDTSRGVQRLASRIARLVNLVAGRSGRFWRERYHRVDLRKPRQVRNALVYCLFNARKHARGPEAKRARKVLDVRCSSVVWIDGWDADDSLKARIAAARADPPIVASPTTYLVRRGWRRHGDLRPNEMPQSAG